MTATGNHPRWDRVKPVAPLAAVLGIVGIAVGVTMAVSYWHEYLLAHHNGQARWISALVPVSIDGIVLVTSIALLWAASNGIKDWRRLWRPLLWLAVGAVATVSANFYSDVAARWLGPAVSASSGVALILISDVAFWMLAEARKMRHPAEAQPAAACSCPPPPAPPVSLAEALPLAREQLRRDGEPAGEQALADRFGVSRHQVRTVLTTTVERPAPTDAAGEGPGSDPGHASPRPPSLNGHGAA